MNTVYRETERTLSLVSWDNEAGTVCKLSITSYFVLLCYFPVFSSTPISEAESIGGETSIYIAVIYQQTVFQNCQISDRKVYIQVLNWEAFLFLRAAPKKKVFSRRLLGSFHVLIMWPSFSSQSTGLIQITWSATTIVYKMAAKLKRQCSLEFCLFYSCSWRLIHLDVK